MGPSSRNQFEMQPAEETPTPTELAVVPGGTLGRTPDRPPDRPPEPGASLPSALAYVFDGTRALLVAVLSYLLFFNLALVRGSSMSPGIEDGDRILVEPWSYSVGEVERGDVVVMRYPLDPTVDYIKRIIGLPGEHVVLADGHVWVDGELLDEPYVANVDPSAYHSSRVADEHYFVLGDNRPRSSDSREFGLVDSSLIRGRVDLRVWPPSRAGWID